MASLDGYVGSAEDGARIARMGKKREEERRQFEEAQKRKESRIADAGLRTFAGASTEQIEHAFKNETVGRRMSRPFLGHADIPPRPPNA